ncbi:uncharacterized protein LOC124497463 [Dermatophagoides farinae]|uniref:uncharacterized protein LOC124497463 n=1 Tax=Dermatophagoides farinae TaxID=6954 RepID=UPI003F5F391A
MMKTNFILVATAIIMVISLVTVNAANGEQKMKERQKKLLDEANDMVKKANDCWNEKGKGKFDETTSTYKEYYLQVMEISKYVYDIEKTTDDKYLDIYEKDMHNDEDILRGRMSDLGCSTGGGTIAINLNTMTAMIAICMMMVMNFVF